MITNKIMNCFVLLVLAIFLPIASSTQVNAQPYVLKLVADTNTIMPGSDITYEDFGPPVSVISPESEAYFGTAGTTNGIYNNVGGTLNVVANNRTPVPGGVGNFKTFSRPETLFNGADVAFSATSFGRQGVYTWIDGTFELVADSTMVLPGTVGTFSTFLRPVSLGNGDIAFRAENFITGEQGIFRHFNGTLELVADTGTPIPGGTGNFTSLDLPVRSENGTVVFRGQGSGGQSGIYIFSGGTLSVIADENTPIPGGTGNFTAFDGDPIVAGGNTVAIEGNGPSSQNGYYLFMGGTLSKIIDRSDTFPGGTGTMQTFGDPIYLGTPGDIGFAGVSDMNENGVLTFIGGVVSAAVDNSDAIPGGVGNFTGFTSHYESIGGADLAFEATGPSGQRGIYTVIGGTLGLVADRNTPIPNGLGQNFSAFSFIIDLGSKNITFRGSGQTSGVGLYDFIDGMLGLVADTRTPVPEGFEDFLGLSDPQPVQGAFETSFAATSAGQQGDYTHINFALGLVADKNTPVPGGLFDFEEFSRLDPISIGNDDVAFFGQGTTDLSDMTQQGYYSFISNVLAVVADLDTAIPGGTGDFTGFPLCAGGGGGGGGGIVGGGAVDLSTNEAESLAVDTHNIVSPSDGNMAFLGEGSGGQIGIYSSIGGALGVIADTSTSIPGGGGTFTNFTCVVSLGGGEVTFLAETSTGVSGVYATMGGSIVLIADTNTAVPDGTGNFEGFSVPVSIDNSDVAFLANFNFGQQGIYRSIGGVLSRVVDFTTPVPGGGTFFFLSDPVSLGGGDVTFKGIGSLIGIYTYIGGTLDVLVDTNTAVPGGSGNFTNFREPVTLGLTVGARDIAFVGFVP